jgi:type II secretion system protein N
MKTFLYFIYIISATGFFLYLLFPAAAVERHMAFWVERHYPGIRLSLFRLQPKFPPGFLIDSGQFLFHNVPLIRADTIQIVPQTGSLFRPLKRIAFQGNTSGGRFNGTIGFAKSDPAFQIQVDAGLTGVRIEKVPFLQSLNIDGLSGVCDCRIQSAADSSVTARLKISECKGAFLSSISGAGSILGTESTSFKKVVINLDYRKGEVQISETHFEGPLINGSVSGVVIIKEPFGKSLLKLAGKISLHGLRAAGIDEKTPFQLLSQKNPTSTDVDFKIEGTLAEPAFSFPGQ